MLFLNVICAHPSNAYPVSNIHLATTDSLVTAAAVVHTCTWQFWRPFWVYLG